MASEGLATAEPRCSKLASGRGCPAPASGAGPIKGGESGGKSKKQPKKTQTRGRNLLWVALLELGVGQGTSIDPF